MTERWADESYNRYGHPQLRARPPDDELTESQAASEAQKCSCYPAPGEGTAGVTMSKFACHECGYRFHVEELDLSCPRCGASRRMIEDVSNQQQEGNE